MKRLDDGTVDLAFADPPFNIGYDYDVYEDRLEGGALPGLEPAVDGRGGPRAQAQRHVLAGHRRRVRRRTEGDAPAGARLTCRSWVVWYYTFGVNCKTSSAARTPICSTW